MYISAIKNLVSMFAPVDNKIVGSNIAKLRRHRDVKAADIASRLGLTESAYTKYERGETAITIDFLNKVSEEFEVSLVELINSIPTTIIENIHNNRTVGVNSTLNITNEGQDKLLESVIEQNKKLTALLEKLADKL